MRKIKDSFGKQESMVDIFYKMVRVDDTSIYKWLNRIDDKITIKNINRIIETHNYMKLICRKYSNIKFALSTLASLNLTSNY